MLYYWHDISIYLRCQSSILNCAICGLLIHLSLYKSPSFLPQFSMTPLLRHLLLEPTPPLPSPCFSGILTNTLDSFHFRGYRLLYEGNVVNTIFLTPVHL